MHFSLSIVIPCYNEEARFPMLVKAVVEFDEVWQNEYELILVDDGSSDQTLARMHSLKSERAIKYANIKVLALDKNSGKGAALRAGVLEAQNDWILTCDADMATHPLQVKKWYQQVNGFSSDKVYIGSRINKESNVEAKWYRKYVGAIYNGVTKIFTPVDVGDTQCGFKLYPVDYAKLSFGKLKTMGWAHDIEVLSRCVLNGAEIISMPVTWEHKEGAKINIFSDGIRMLIETIKIGALLKEERKKQR